MGSAAALGLGAASAPLGIISSVANWQAQKKQNEFEQQTAQQNIGLANYGAKSAEERGAQQEEASRLKYGAVRGTQLAGYGASGVTATAGSPLATIANTEAMSDYDAKTIHANAAKEAWGYQTQAAEQQQRLGMLKQARSGLDTGLGLSIAGSLLGAGGSMLKTGGGNTGT
jgi:hypothetical protein